MRGEVERRVDFVNEITSRDVTDTRTEKREVLFINTILIYTELEDISLSFT